VLFEMASRRRPKSHSRLGKIFEAEVSASLKYYQNHHQNFWFHRLPDTMSYIMSQVPNVILPQQPADYIALSETCFFLLEAKSLHTSSFPLEHLKEHQKKALAEVDKCGGVSLILFSFRKEKPVKCYATPIVKYMGLEAEAKREGRKSIDEEAIKKVSIEVPRLTRVGWDFTVLF